ncbi:MAG: hypothetical protein SPK63_01150 [Eubacteriales bacterium]|nr:hypothetical protein [Eubacteriales bacterium]
MSKKKKIIISSVSVGIVLIGVILTIILVNIKRFSLRASDYLNFNNHTTMNIIELDSSVTPSSSPSYNNGTTIITHNSSSKLGVFSYIQNKTIAEAKYDDVLVKNPNSKNGKTYFELVDNSKSSDITLIDEKGNELSIISESQGTKNRASIMTKDVSVREKKNKVKTKIGNKYTQTSVSVKRIEFDDDYSNARGYFSDELKNYETWKITTTSGITYTNLYKLENGTHKLIQTLDNELGNSLESKDLSLEFLNDGTPIFMNMRSVKFGSDYQAMSFEIYDINFNLKGKNQIDMQLLNTDISFRIGNSLFFQIVIDANEDKYDYSTTNTSTGVTTYHTIKTYKFSLKNGSFDEVNFDYLINKVGAEFNVDTVLLSCTQIKNKKLDTSSILLINERLQTKKIDYDFDTILKVNNDRYITSTGGNSNFNLIDKSYNLIAHLDNFNNVFATNDSIIVSDSNVTYICNTDGVVIKKISNGNFEYLQDCENYINKVTTTEETLTTTKYYLERLGLSNDEPLFTKSTDGDTYQGISYKKVNLYTIKNPRSNEIVATIIIRVSEEATNYVYEILNIDGKFLGSITSVSMNLTPIYFYSNDNAVVLSLGTKLFALDR